MVLLLLRKHFACSTSDKIMRASGHVRASCIMSTLLHANYLLRRAYPAMDRSLFWFIVAFSLLITSWLVFLCRSCFHSSILKMRAERVDRRQILHYHLSFANTGLSTCLGEPLRLLLSSLWERLLSYADSQPTPARVKNWSSRRDGSSFSGTMPYTRLGGGRRNWAVPSAADIQYPYEDEVELTNWKTGNGYSANAKGRMRSI